jgi:mandelate racemase
LSVPGVSLSAAIRLRREEYVLAVTPTVHWLEHLDIAGAILAERCQLADGKLSARGPGLGLQWDEAAIKRYII